MVDVRHAVDDPDDASLEGGGLARPGVIEDPVAHLGRQVEPAPVSLEVVDDAQRVLVVTKVAAVPLLQEPVERLLACVAERRMPEVVTEPDRLDQVLVQPKRPGDAAGDAGGLERVRQPGADMVALGRDEDLRLVLEAPERLAVDDAVAVALEGRAQAAIGLVGEPSPGLVRARRQRRQPRPLVLLDVLREGVRDPAGKLWHRQSVVGGPLRAGLLVRGSGTPRAGLRQRGVTGRDMSAADKCSAADPPHPKPPPTRGSGLGFSR